MLLPIRYKLHITKHDQRMPPASALSVCSLRYQQENQKTK